MGYIQVALQIYQNIWHVFHKVMDSDTEQLQQCTKTEHLNIAWTVKVTLFPKQLYFFSKKQAIHKKSIQ